MHQVRLEHGTASGKRVITVDGKEVGCLCSVVFPMAVCAVRCDLQILRKKWMFSLVGTENFKISSRAAEIIISCKGQFSDCYVIVM